MNPLLTHLECTRCCATKDPGELTGACPCGATYFARYDLARIADIAPKSALATATPDQWRYRHVLPIDPNRAPVSLSEGNTPCISVGRLGESLDLSALYVKDESLNPTGSFKARGMSTAISVAATLGARRVALPSAGNAALAAAAYCARIGLPLVVYLPEKTPYVFLAAVKALGAEMVMVAGSIADAGARMVDELEERGLTSLATLKEPYRVEGKKTMGYELAEAFDWELPDVVIYPTGGGTGLIGMWKAFAEMQEMGWIGPKRPRMVAVQAAGCDPIISAYEAGAETATHHPDPQTVASGLRVPGSIGDFLILSAIRESEGTAVRVTDRELLSGVTSLARHTGIFAAPEAGATVAAARSLRRSGWLAQDDRVVLFVTGTGLSYVAP